MDTPNSLPNSNDDRLKFLCSFNGSILPRPQDGKLRYVGGETRIVTVPRVIGFDELMSKMKELFDGICVLKYQQPDEDLDALVSVVNDDDVINMMEEYEKLGYGDGFTRIRIFLFSGGEVDETMLFVERDSERRYVDALNAVDEVNLIENCYSQLNIDENCYSQRNLQHFEMAMSPVNLQHVRICNQQMEPPWTPPAYYSPRNNGNDYPSSPSSSRYHSPYGDVDRSFEREDYFRQPPPPLQPPQPPSSSRYHSPYGDMGDRSFEREDYFRQPPPPPLQPPQYVTHQPPFDQQFPFPETATCFHQVAIPFTECPYGQSDPRSHYIRHGAEFGNDMFPTSYGSPHGHIWRNGQSPTHGHQENGAYNNLGYVGTTTDSGSRFPVRVENQSPTEPAQFVPAPVQFVPAPVQFMPAPVQFTSDQVQFSTEPISELPTMSDDMVISVKTPNLEAENDSSSGKTAFKNEELEVEGLSNVAQLIESVKLDEVEGGDEKDKAAQENVAFAAVSDAKVEEKPVQELDAVDAPVDLEPDSDNDTKNNAKIEPTKAEEEAISRGLQTIKNDDLEEIKQLGCGTYGAVYHGKWKGSDVAIKRIKASCFAGRPSERERLIADFWKEALILSSLHHPNVVSFYGIVRDGPDGSLATLTEFMVNGSLKQFLQKKDRTIDRRKRLIIAMDASFGMEYLHGKNIVHFDLKCENLLVNMRDPHRPICKIGDLGLSKVKQHTLVSGGVRGTLPWMAPELLSGKSNMVTDKIDVYSFGIVMWELLTGDEPYGDMHCASIIGGIVNDSLRPTTPTWCDPEWKALMGSCWSSDPTQRPSFSEISHKLRTMAAAINVK